VSLAASLVADGHRVALVDCDLHQPNVHRMFEGPRGPGLTDYFIGDAALSEIVHTDRGSGVDYVRAGAAQSQEACHITFDRLRAVVERLIKEYTFVILDSAPVLAVSEATLLSQIAQRTIFVIRWGRTPRSIARHAVIQLLESGGAETGCFFRWWMQRVQRSTVIRSPAYISDWRVITGIDNASARRKSVQRLIGSAYWLPERFKPRRLWRSRARFPRTQT